MATLQKIRNKGKFLIIALGLALFAFIAEEGVRAISSHHNENRQSIGKIYGKKINVQEFNEMVEEYTDVIKFTNGLSTLSDEQLSSLRDQVWQNYVNEQIIERECEKLGLCVTDAEIQHILKTGNNPMLAQTPFRTQQGTFDVAALTQFLTQYKDIMADPQTGAELKEQYTMMYNYWKFVEKSIRSQVLGEKYHTLLSSTIISNPASTKDYFEGRVNESEIFLAALPYSSIKDTEIEVKDSEMKAKYEELKELFRTTDESRDIKYIDIHVTASPEDQEALQKEMEEYAQALTDGADVAKTVREAASQVPYSTLPVSRNGLPSDIASELDSLSVGAQKGPYVNTADNTINIIRLLAKTQLPDSIEVRQIFAPGKDMADSESRADSILNVLNQGVSIDSIAKQFDQTASKAWITSSQYERALVNENDHKYLSLINNAQVNAYNKLVLDGQGTLIIQVTDRKHIITKYDVAVIKRTIDFSKETYSRIYNEFSSFLAANTNAESIEANAAKAGYKLQTRSSVRSIEHTVADVQGTRDAMRWIFDEDTKKGDVSQLYECGQNDHMLVVILGDIHKKGYLAWNDELIKNELTSEVLKDKKAVQLQEKMKDMKSIAEVSKIKDIITDTINHVSFSSNTFVVSTGSSEPVISGAVSKAKKGDFKSGIKGNAAVFAIQVLNQTKNDTKYDKKQESDALVQNNLRGLAGFIGDLRLKANVIDNRYLFY